LDRKFAWQVGFGAFSTSESQVSTLRGYIGKQKEHHKKMTFEEEYQKFIKLHELENLDDFDGEE
jgi:hypothetical protein